jgi:hypothetical protein
VGVSGAGVRFYAADGVSVELRHLLVASRLAAFFRQVTGAR